MLRRLTVVGVVATFVAACGGGAANSRVFFGAPHLTFPVSQSGIYTVSIAAAGHNCTRLPSPDSIGDVSLTSGAGIRVAVPLDASLTARVYVTAANWQVVGADIAACDSGPAPPMARLTYLITGPG